MTEEQKLRKREYNKKYREANKDKIKEQQKEYYEANKDKIKEKIACKKYNITPRQHQKLMAINECQICFKHIEGRDKNIDHCHKTGEIRGVLCSHCNTSLGGFNDDLTIINKAIQYLEKENKND